MKPFILAVACLMISMNVRAQFVKAELEVSGLTCSMCSLSTQKSLKTLDFVGEIKPDLNKNIFYIAFKPGKTVKLDALKERVLAAGFSVSKLIAVFNFNNVKASSGTVYNYEGSSYNFINTKDQVLEGPTRLQVLDKEYLPARQFKKLNSAGTIFILPGTAMPSAHAFHVTVS